MFTLRSPRRNPQNQISDTFSNTFVPSPIHNRRFNQNIAFDEDFQQTRKNYQQFLENKKMQQTFMSQQLKQEIQNKRRFMETHHNNQNIQEQAENILASLKTMNRPPRIHPPEIHNPEPIQLGEIKSIREYMDQSPRRSYYQKPRRSYIPERPNWNHPIKSNFSKYVIPPPKQVEFTGKKLFSSSELVYPDGHFSAVTTSQGSRK